MSWHWELGRPAGGVPSLSALSRSRSWLISVKRLVRLVIRSQISQQNLGVGEVDLRESSLLGSWLTVSPADRPFIGLRYTPKIVKWQILSVTLSHRERVWT